MKILITSKKHIASYQLAFLLKENDIIFGESFTDFPLENSNSLAHQLLAFCLTHQIEKVFPLRYSELEALAESKVLFEEFGIDVMLSNTELNFINHEVKLVNSYTELSMAMIALGYPNQKIAIEDTSGRGELILIDDEVKDNYQIWNQIKTINFNQLGKWFNQTNFQPINLYAIDDSFHQFYILMIDGEMSFIENIHENILNEIKSVLLPNYRNGFYHVVINNHKIIQIKYATI